MGTIESDANPPSGVGLQGAPFRFTARDYRQERERIRKPLKRQTFKHLHGRKALKGTEINANGASSLYSLFVY